MFCLSLKNKLIITVILAFIFFGTIANVFIFRNIKETFLEITKEEITVLNSEKASSLADIFKGGQDLSKLIAQNNKIIDYLEGDIELQDKTILEILNNYNIDDSYSAIYIMNPSGMTLVSTNPAFVGNNYSFRDYFQEALAGQAWIDLAIGITSKQVGYYFSTPIKSLEGDILGVLIAKMKPDNIHNKIHVSGLYRDKQVMLIDEHGIIVHSSNEALIYKSLGKLSQEQLELIETKKRFSGITIESLAYDIVLDKICGEKCNNFTTQFFNELEQEEELISISRINGYPFYLFSEYRLKELSKVSKTTTSILSIIIGLLAIAAIIIILLFVNKFLRPLSDLKKCALEISKDNYSYKYNIKTGDELEELGNTINRMSRKLKKSRESLKQKLTISKRVNKTLVGRELAMRTLKKENTDLRKELRNKSK